MMLRASVKNAGGEVDLSGVTGTSETGLPHGAALVRFVDAAVVGTSGDRDRERALLVDEAGPAFTLDAAAVIANFEMMTRLADATGAAYAEAARAATASVRALVGADALASARWG